MRSSASAEGYARYDYWRPRGTRWIEALVRRVDGLFDRIYSSRYNPLYRTGTLAALFLTVAFVSGVYLICVYQISRPYESVLAIQRDVLLGRWMRAVHRYASDAAVLAVALHVVRLVVQGKTWGPRMLAWITGVLLTGMMFLSAFTGFVLVWDELGQKIAVAGARLLRPLPLFVEPPERAFSGGKPVPAAFFFMNLFLHVAIPLGMVGFLWLHTSRLARAAWLPERKVVWGTVGGLVALAIVWPAPLPPAADLLAIPGRIRTDWFYAFWLPLADLAPAVALATVAVVGAFVLASPWVVTPRARRRPAAAWADPDKCEGCRQCSMDCPYDAIRMVDGKYPERHPLRAEVVPDLCVSCGLCAGSCASLAIGPESRTAAHQLAAARQLVAATADAARRTLLIACRNNGAAADRLRGWREGDGGLAGFDVDCAGTLHPGTVSYLVNHFAGVVIASCPPQNCVHREGATLADARILLDRPPAVPGRLAGQRVLLLHHSIAEWPRIVAAIRDFAHPGRPSSEHAAVRAARGGLALAFSVLLLALVALGSGWPQGVDRGHARETCRDLTPEELAARPVHMRQPRACTSEALTYDLSAVVDGRVVMTKRVRPPGLRGDRPLSLEEDLAIEPGDHVVAVTFTPDDPGGAGKRLAIERRLRFEPKRVVLVTYENGVLVVRQ
jgi:ferredoxin